MAGRTPVAVTSVSRAALTALPNPSIACDATNGNVCANDGFTVLHLLNNDGAATHNVTVQIVSGVDGATAGPKSYTLPISTTRQVAGPFPLQYYGSQLLINADSAQVAVMPVSFLSP